MKNICENCQYWRQKSWCSNSKSPRFRYGLPNYPPEEVFVMPSDTCDQFYQRGKEAPLELQMANRLLGWAKN